MKPDAPIAGKVSKKNVNGAVQGSCQKRKIKNSVMIHVLNVSMIENKSKIVKNNA